MSRLAAPLAWRIWGLTLVALVAIAVAPTAGLSRAQDADADAVALLQQATTTMGELDSFHFELTTPRGETLLIENIELASLSGDVQRPDRFRAAATAKAAIIDVEVIVIGVGTRLWVTDPLSDGERWIEFDISEMTGEDPGALVDLLNPDRVLLTAIRLVEDPVIVGDDELDGVETTIVEGYFDPARIAELATPVPGLRLDQPLLAAAWIDNTGLVHRIEIEGPLTNAESDNVVRRLDLSAFNEPVEIEPPA
jgi:lipoprotein LprA